MVAPVLALIIPTVVAKVIDKLTEDPKVPEVTPELGKKIKQEILQEIVTDPRVQHATNTEPAIKSRVMWGSLSAILAGVGQIMALYAEGNLDFGQMIPPIMAILGGFVALYGRFAARTPIGGT